MDQLMQGPLVAWVCCFSDRNREPLINSFRTVSFIVVLLSRSNRCEPSKTTMTIPPPNWITFNSSTEPFSTRSCRECESSRFSFFFLWLFIYLFTISSSMLKQRRNTRVWQRTKQMPQTCYRMFIYKPERIDWLGWRSWCKPFEPNQNELKH